jgi:hypothetical protein
MHHHDVGKADDACYRNDVADEIEIQFVVDGNVDRIRRGNQEKGMTVGGGAHHDLGCDVAISPRPVFNDERLA